jgi:hypothetical protein
VVLVVVDVVVVVLVVVVLVVVVVVVDVVVPSAHLPNRKSKKVGCAPLGGGLPYTLTTE